MNTDQWHADLHFFARKVQKHHKNPFHFTSEERFTEAVAALDAQIPLLKEHEIIVGLQCLAAMIGDGHTFVATRNIQHCYPLDVYWFKGELRVVRAALAYKEALGMRLVAVHGVSIAEINVKIQCVIPQAENEWYVLQQSAQQIMYADVLASLGIVPQIGQTPFTFEDDQGRQRIVNIEPIAPNAKRDWISVTKNTPLHLQRTDEPFWFVDLPDAQAVYVNFRSYTGLEQHAQHLWEFVDHSLPQRLIIDMRHNGGGNYTLARSHIIYEIQNRPALNRPGFLFVIIGRGTFSAAMTSATDFRRETDAILVGEPTGAQPNGYQENHWLRLTNSGLRVSVASRRYRFQHEDTPAVMPDHRIEPDWTTYSTGHDPVVKWILSEGSNNQA